MIRFRRGLRGLAVFDGLFDGFDRPFDEGLDLGDRFTPIYSAKGGQSGGGVASVLLELDGGGDPLVRIIAEQRLHQFAEAFFGDRLVGGAR